MKKLSALFVLMVVLGTSVPAYCAQGTNFILVYKVTISGKVVDKGWEELSSAKVSAYLVLGIYQPNPSTYPFIVDSRLVVYGKYEGDKIYDTASSLGADMELLGDPEDDICIVTMEPPGSAAVIFGMVKFTDIGLSEKKWIPTKLSGGMVINGDFFGLAEIAGSAKVSAKFDSKLTKKNVSGSVNSTVVSIIDILQAQHYQPNP
ncbi:MAG: hypothetical protein JW749_01860 [Sedimentisphaerales bacterium]|nr:hypothetical protein [Sedimentisphaerales bacterium]